MTTTQTVLPVTTGPSHPPKGTWAASLGTAGPSTFRVPGSTCVAGACPQQLCCACRQHRAAASLLSTYTCMVACELACMPCHGASRLRWLPPIATRRG
eukprot:366093-Chlamydomonas_euryale.AAC.10